MNVHFVYSQSLNDTHYLDVCIIDGVMKTFLMHKIEEPNVFGVLKEEDGDTRNTIIEYVPK